MGNGELRLKNDIFDVIKGILLGNGLLLDDQDKY